MSRLFWKKINMKMRKDTASIYADATMCELFNNPYAYK